jgi:serine/threonine protein kinase/WD40 repeat protein
MPSRQIEDQFIATYVEDLHRNRVRPLVDYQALFPGHETTIAREYRLLEEDDLGDAGPGTTAGGHDPAEDPRQTIGRYQIQRKLGRGGQARVFLAHDPRLDRDVALKVLETTRFGLDVESRIQRFRREAEITARLDHPGICSVLEVGEDEPAGVVYIAMRYIEGHTLAKLIANATGQDSNPKAVALPLSEDSDVSGSSTEGRSRWSSDTHSIHRVLKVVEKIARALHIAHEQGLVHRDVKPGNIMISTAGEPVVLDFGLARDEDSEALGLTLSGDVLGTPYYMSPEQVRGEHATIDRRTDIYSLGVTLYECLTLRRPFQGASREALYQQILGEPPADPSRLNRSIPRDLKIVLETALEKDRKRRYPTALAFADDMRRLRRYQPITARALPVTLRSRRWVQRNPAVATFVGVLLVALAVTFYLLQTVQARNVELEKINVADTYRQVAESLEAGRPRAPIWETLNSMPEDQKGGFTWRWLAARGRPLQPLVPAALGQGPNCETPVRSIAFDGTGKRLLAIHLPVEAGDARTSLSSGDLRVMDLGTEEWSPPFGTAHCAAFSPDHRLILAGDSRPQRAGIELFDSETLKPVADRTLLDKPIVAVSFSPDGQSVVAAELHGSLRLFRLVETDRNEPRKFKLEPVEWKESSIQFRVRALHFSPDGQRLLVAGNSETAWIIDLPWTGGSLSSRTPIEFYREQGKTRFHQELDPSRIFAGRFSPDGKLVVLAGALGKVALFEAASGNHHRDLHGHLQEGRSTWRYATGAFFDPWGRYVFTSGWDGLLQVHDVSTGRRLTYIRTGNQLAAAIDPEGTKIAIASVGSVYGTGAGQVSVFDLGSLCLPVELVGPDPRGILEILTTKDGRFAYSVSAFGEVHKHDLQTGEQLFAIRDHMRFPRCIALRPPDERELAIGYESGRYEVVDTETGDLLRRSLLPREYVRPPLAQLPKGFSKLSYGPKGKLLAAGLGSDRDRKPNRRVPVILLDAESLEQVDGGVLEGHRDKIAFLWFDPDGSHLLSGDQLRQLSCWDVRGRRLLWTRETGTQFARSNVWIMGDRICVRDNSNTLTVFHMATGEETEPIPVGSGSPWSSRDGRETLSITGSRVVVSDFPSHNQLLVLPIEHPPGTAAARFVGDTGVLAGGMVVPFSYHEIQPDPARLRERQISWAAGRLVRDLLRELLLHSEVRERLETNATLDAEVRAVALRILAGTSRDPGILGMATFQLMGASAEGFSPQSVETYKRVILLMQEARVGVTPGMGRDRVSLSVLGMAHYRTEAFAEAVGYLRRATAIDAPPLYPDSNWPLAFLRDVWSYPLFYLAMCEQRVGDGNGARATLEDAWAKGIGGVFDAQAAREVYEVFDLLPDPPGSVEEQEAWEATGPPNASKWNGGDAAWYPPSTREQHELELEYEEAIPATALGIFEVNAPGVVVKVIVETESGQPTSFEVDNRATEPGRVEVNFGKEIAVKSVRLVLSETRRGGRKGIDAVQLVGSDGMSRWPSRARLVRR